MNTSHKVRLTIVTAAAGAVTAGAVALPALADGTPSGTTPSATSTAQPGSGTDQQGAAGERSERKDPLASVLSTLVQQGKLTQAKADAITKAAQAEREQHGDRGPGKGGRGHHGGGLMGLDRAKVAQAAGATEAELDAAVKAGTSLSALAQSKGVDKDTLVSRLTELVKGDIAQAVDRTPQQGPGRGEQGPGRGAEGGPLAGVLANLVKQGTLTQAEADTVSAALKAEHEQHRGEGPRGGHGPQQGPGGDQQGPGGQQGQGGPQQGPGGMPGGPQQGQGSQQQGPGSTGQAPTQQS